MKGWAGIVLAGIWDSELLPPRALKSVHRERGRLLTNSTLSAIRNCTNELLGKGQPIVRRLGVFHRTVVTSELATRAKRAEHGQGGGGIRDFRRSSAKCFVVKILTSKPLGLKILQRLFAGSAPGKAFHGDGEGGTPRAQGSRKAVPVLGDVSCRFQSIFSQEISTALQCCLQLRKIAERSN